MTTSALTVPLRQHGNSVGLTLPKAFLDALGLIKGAQVDVLLRDGLLEVRPHIEPLSLDSLMASYDPAKHNYDDLLPGQIGKEGEF